jgi:hypothetical protein
MKNNYKIVFSDGVDNQCENIFYYIGLDNEKKAMSFIDEMMSYFTTRLSQMPFSCQKVKGKVRMLSYKR